MSRYTFIAAALASVAVAKTDLTGCTTTDVSSPAGASVAWYVPGTGELCDFLDCGGGRAPPKTTVPGCPLYSGTVTYSPSYLAGYGSMTASSSSVVSETSSASASASSSATYDLSFTSTITSAVESTALGNSAVAISTLTSTASSGMSTITSPAVVIAGNGTSAPGYAGGSGHNGTIVSASPSSTSSMDSGAMETARVWFGGAGLIGLGAIVAAL